MATLYLSPASLIVQYLTNIGILAQNGTLNTYVGGTVNTPLTTFTDSTGATQNPNPMTLSSAARPASTSGAPVAFWHASGQTLTLQVFDASGAQLVYLPSMPAINDPSGANSLQTLLANPAQGDGADLVANAMKSYLTVSNVQATVSPTLVAGQTLIIDVTGQASANDGLGGLFYWSATSNAADDNGVTTISPSGSPSTGRYVRLSQYSSTSFTGTLTGMTSATTGTVKYARKDNLVTLWIDANIFGTSNSVNMTMTGLPASLNPANQRDVLCTDIQNAGGGPYFSHVSISNAGVVSFFIGLALGGSPNLIGANTASNNFTNSGQKGLMTGWSITYTL